MNIEIKKYDQENASVCNDLLTKLINDEIKYDENLKNNIIINNYYNKLNESINALSPFLTNEQQNNIKGILEKLK